MTLRRKSRFVGVGSIGFLVDAGVLTILANGFGVDPLLSRVPSFGLAVAATYFLNRVWTFGDRRGGGGQTRIFSKYFGSQIAGVSVNLVVYTTLIALYGWAREYPALPQAIASVMAMFLTYFLSARFVFVAGDGNAAKH